MMTVRLRIATMVARWLLMGRPSTTEPVQVLQLRCTPFDCDINGHMNNSRYLSLMDLGRWHYILAGGLWKPVREWGWAPVAVRVEIDYKQSLQPFERFTLETRVVAGSARSITIQQRFLRGEAIAAEAKVVVLFLAKGKVQDLAPLHAAMPHAAPPGWVLPVDGEVDQREALHVG